MSVPNEDTEMVMRAIVHENWKNVLSETIHARQVCGMQRRPNIVGTGAIAMINGTSSFLYFYWSSVCNLENLGIGMVDAREIEATSHINEETLDHTNCRK